MWVWNIARGTAQPSCRVEKCSGWLLRGPWQTSRRSCWPTSPLASSMPRPAQEILSLFRRLNQDGTTLVVVTHDEQLAAEAGRIIHMLDGRISGPEDHDHDNARAPASRRCGSFGRCFCCSDSHSGVGVMIVLLSVGQAMLDQSRDVSLVGGGALTVLPQGIDVEAMRTGGLSGMFFGIERAKFLGRQVFGGPRHEGQVEVVSPLIEGKLLYLRHGGRTVAVRSGGEVPSRASAIGAGLSIQSGSWSDSPADSAYIIPTAQQLYDELDHFHFPSTRGLNLGRVALLQCGHESGRVVVHHVSDRRRSTGRKMGRTGPHHPPCSRWSVREVYCPRSFQRGSVRHRQSRPEVVQEHGPPARRHLPPAGSCERHGRSVEHRHRLWYPTGIATFRRSRQGRNRLSRGMSFPP